MESPALDLLAPPARRHSPRVFRFIAPLTISATIVGWLGFCLLKSAWVAWWRTLRRLWHGLVIAYGVAWWLYTYLSIHNLWLYFQYRWVVYHEYLLGFRVLYLGYWLLHHLGHGDHVMAQAIAWWQATYIAAITSAARDTLHPGLALGPLVPLGCFVAVAFGWSFLRALTHNLAGAPQR